MGAHRVRVNWAAAGPGTNDLILSAPPGGEAVHIRVKSKNRTAAACFAFAIARFIDRDFEKAEKERRK
jgi:hypothetical protein